MAFNPSRFSTFNAGQTGAGIMGKYDGSGTTGEGGEALATIKGSNYLTSKAVKDAVRQASDGRTTGAGLVMLLVGNDGIEWDVATISSGGVVSMRGSAFNIS